MNTITIHTREDYIRETVIPQCDIMYCIADSNYTFIFVENRRWLISKTMKHIQQSLNEGQFIRIHHKYLINSKHIQSINKRQSQVIMKDGQVLQMSRRKKSDVLACIAQVV